MSAIIDNIIFQSLQILNKSQPNIKDSTLMFQIFNKLKINHKIHISQNNAKIYQTKSTFDMPQKTFLVNLHVKKETFNTKFTAVEINQLTNQKITSKHNDLLLMKQFFKFHKEFPPESNVYINNGRSYMIMNSFLPNNKMIKPSKIVEVYNTFIIKNLLIFQNFLKKYIDNRDKKADRDPTRLSQFQKQLQLARIVNTTHSTSNIQIEKSQFKSANNSFEKRKSQLLSIKQMIQEQVFFYKITQKFYNIVPEETCASWIKQNYIDYYMQNQKKLHNVLKLAISGERKLEDYVYNTVKIQIKQKLGGNAPLNAGASCHIWGALADITYISSTYMKMPAQNIEKIERFIAIKKLKSNDPKRPSNKIQHQKAIILNMRGSICPFLPKYYGTQKQSQLSNCLVMQLIQGQDLDDYMNLKLQTLTLWTKIYLLLNIIHGIRHLLNYQITHLDLKPLNIKVAKNMITKIFDFGQAYHPEVCSKEYAAASTFPYASPEVFTRFSRLYKGSGKSNLDDYQYSQKQDSYAFGVIMYQIIFGNCIFTLSQSKLRETCIKRQIQKRIYLAPERVEDYGQAKILSSILYIIVRCLDLDSAKRPCFEWIGISLKLMLHSYINFS